MKKEGRTFSWTDLFTVAPLHTTLVWMFIIPPLLLGFMFVILLGGVVLQALYNILQGISRPSAENPVVMVYEPLANYCYAGLDFFIPFGDMGVKILGTMAYLLAAVFFFLKAIRLLEREKGLDREQE
jgi:hypothetical protein